MSNAGDSQRVTTLWHMSFEGNSVICSVYRRGAAFELRVESPHAVIVSEPFELEPRALARAQALRDGLKRRGWTDVATRPTTGSDA